MLNKILLSFMSKKIKCLEKMHLSMIDVVCFLYEFSAIE